MERQPYADGGTMPLRAGSSQSMVSLAGAASSMPLATAATAVLAAQGSILTPEMDLPSVIDYPLYSTQCKIRWQVSNEGF